MLFLALDMILHETAQDLSNKKDTKELVYNNGIF